MTAELPKADTNGTAAPSNDANNVINGIAAQIDHSEPGDNESKIDKVSAKYAEDAGDKVIEELMAKMGNGVRHGVKTIQIFYLSTTYFVLTLLNCEERWSFMPHI